MELNIVLVGSLYSRNVGYVSRAMANMGANRLILVNCQCDYNLEARQGAAGAQTHLVTATRYSSWQEFFANESNGVRIAFCARKKKETDTLTFEARWSEILQNEPDLPYYLIFGPEDHGLSNIDLEYANHICELPTFGSFKSMNLAHAVMVALYIARSTAARVGRSADLMAAGTAQDSGSNDEAFYFPVEALNQWLTTLGFKIGDRRVDAYKVLKRILLNARATPKELRILEAIVYQTIRKLQQNQD